MEKIKIYVTEHIASVLEKDAEGFEFFKKDGRTVNKNALLTNLVVNYYKNFAGQQTDLLDFLKNKISATAKVAENSLNGLCFDLCEKLNERSAAPNGEKFDKLVSFKPTKESEPIIDYIESYCLMGRTLSEYFRSMFASYVALPQDKREIIIFKPQYDAITKAIKEQKRIFFTTRRGHTKKTECAPYAIATSKEEMHCYVLNANKTCTPVRLSRIVSVTQLAADATFTPTQIALFEKMKTYGPQFIYRTDDSEVLVELTAKGIDKFKRIYVHRPIPTKVENNYYYFNCSRSQIVQYFIRLGADAKIIYPQNVRDEVFNYHRRACNRYYNRGRKPATPEQSTNTEKKG
ncbi:MAG: WYL domain-containing protein [Clostridia bacterium]|nr:WYL domain-containing protein [Clostridia bacterium]